MGKLRPTKFDNAKICSNCGIEFMPNPKDRIYCKSCDPQNSGMPIEVIKVPDKDIIREDKLGQFEWKLVDLESRVKKLESFVGDNVKVSEKVKETPALKSGEQVKGHYPKVCADCGETFIAQFPAEKLCKSCKEKRE